MQVPCAPHPAGPHPYLAQSSPDHGATHVQTPSSPHEPWPEHSTHPASAAHASPPSELVVPGHARSSQLTPRQPGAHTQSACGAE